ncbi:MAG: hypothetical protein ACR2PR_06290 [Pseudohongiellaceae bacterium]
MTQLASAQAPAETSSEMPVTRLLDERWLLVETTHFTILSQQSSRQTLRFAQDLENWRQVAAYIIQDTVSTTQLPQAPVPNLVYLIDNKEDFNLLTITQDPAFFAPTPRANFMALAASEEHAMEIALHHYVHFLVRNFLDLRLPRWYEEGLAGYVSRITMDGTQPRFERFTTKANELMVQISEVISLERLIYRDEALASPRLIQIANLKSAALLHYLKHGWEEEQFNDRRPQLARYLELLLEGRNQRFAYDQSFDVTTETLDTLFHTYLLNSARPRGQIESGPLQPLPEYTSVRQQGPSLAVQLAELALNAGQMANAEILFRAALAADPSVARAHSGLGDAIRFQELPVSDQTVAQHFEDALATAPEEPDILLDILLDYGEYWEYELEDCDKTYPATQRQQILANIETRFRQALAIAPDNAEVNLAMGEIYLFPERNWQEGVAYQRRAFELLPADTFIMEQATRYAIESDNYEQAELLITELAQPLHFWLEPEWVTDLRERLLRKRRNEPYDECSED